MKKLISIIVSLALVIALGTSAVYADGWKNSGSDWKSKTYQRSMKKLKEQLKQQHRDQQEREKLLKEIEKLKKKYNDYTIDVYVNGEEVESDDDLPTVIRDGKWHIPLGPILKAMGATVDWDEANHKMTITKTKDGKTTVIVIWTQTNIVTVNGVQVKIEGSIKAEKNGVLVPIDFIKKILGHDVKVDDDGTTIIIEDKDVVTVNDTITGTGNNQFQYFGSWSYGAQSGAYNNDNHWSDTAGTYYEFKFDGQQVKLYGAKAPNHGIAAVSIDGGAEVAVDFYAAVRTENTLFYTSPVLTDSIHTVKVRVTGTRNSSSSDEYVPADRADVFAKVSIVNHALNKTATASSFLAAKEPAKAVDGILTTSWTSEAGDDQSFTIDLGVIRNIQKVKLNWGSTYARNYLIQVSTDASTWETPSNCIITNGNGGADTISLTPVNARYVRLIMTLRSGTASGYVLREIGVYGVTAP